MADKQIQEGDYVPINILLVEDNPADVKITLRAFEKARIKNRLQVVNDGEAALDYVFRRGEYQDSGKYPPPDLILLDIRLPKLNGPEVLERLKADPVHKKIPVVMLTSSKSDEDVLKSYEDGAASYIPKPVDYPAFVKVVENFNFYWHLTSKLPRSQ